MPTASQVLVNYSSSPQRSHRQLLSDAALETVLADLSIMPPSVLILCFRILGNMADMHQALLQENGALETITRALATYPAEQQMQADGVGCLCKIATATGKWSVIAHPNTVDALVALQASNPHPSLAISCAAAFFALARIPVGADCIVQNGGVPALLRAVQVTRGAWGGASIPGAMGQLVLPVHTPWMLLARSPNTTCSGVHRCCLLLHAANQMKIKCRRSHRPSVK